MADGLFALLSGGLPWRVVSVAEQSAFGVQAVVEEATGARRLFRVDVEPEPPRRITLAIAPPIPPDNDGELPASNTAVLTAANRASHPLWDERPVFSDDVAIRLLPEHVAQSVRRAPFGGQLRGVVLRLFVRSRYAEDALFAVIERGTTQYVVLGAGLDTFAYRHPDIAGLRIYEVDHPASQQDKHARLAAATIAEPNSVTFVPVDFESQRLDEQLAASGFDLDKPAFFSWLGVVYYLGREAI